MSKLYPMQGHTFAILDYRNVLCKGHLLINSVSLRTNLLDEINELIFPEKASPNMIVFRHEVFEEVTSITIFRY